MYSDVVGTVRERSIAKIEIKNIKIKKKRRIRMLRREATKSPRVFCQYVFLRVPLNDTMIT